MHACGHYACMWVPSIVHACGHQALCMRVGAKHCACMWAPSIMYAYGHYTCMWAPSIVHSEPDNTNVHAATRKHFFNISSNSEEEILKNSVLATYCRPTVVSGQL